MLGALLASGLAGKFHPAWRVPLRSLIAAVLGGLLLGYGARLAYGCNIGAYFSGIASASVHGWLWLAAAFAGSVLGTYLRPLVRPERRRQPHPRPGGPGRARLNGTRLLYARPADRRVAEGCALHFVGPINVAQVDDHWLRHHALKARQIQRAELLPFGRDHHFMGRLLPHCRHPGSSERSAAAVSPAPCLPGRSRAR